MKQRVRILILLSFLTSSLTAQRTQPVAPPVCGSPELTKTQRRDLSSQAEFALRIKRTNTGGPTGIEYVPIRPHIFRRTDGTGGMSLDKLNNIMAITNGYYLSNGAGIQFYFCGTAPDYVDNDALFNGFAQADESALNGRDALNALNQYYVNTFNPAGMGGYAYFPSNTLISTRSFIMNQVNEADLANRLLPHELGHNFGLFHTFGTAAEGTTELVTRGLGANCTTDGDLLCDTPADPYGMPNASTVYVNGCQTYNGTATDAQGNAYAPSMTNIMSYYLPCTHDFTPGQYDRMQAALALRESHTAYSLDCPATAVAAPTNVAATLTNGTVILTWQDNATNELGYFIERSTSAASGFVPIGGVGPSKLTFTDLNTAGLTTYYYRVRPSNSTTTGISPTASVRTGSCRPSYSSVGCSEGDGLANVMVNQVVLSQNSGCSVGGYSSSTAVSTTVSAGQSYTVSGNFLNASYAQGVTVWADLNRNGVYEADRNERLYQTPAPVVGQFSGRVTLPTTLTAGPLPLRLVLAYDTVPLNACGTYAYGETEDYQLMVAGPPPVADLSVSLRVSKCLPNVGEPVSYSLTLRNNGPDAATGISWQNRLPANLSFVSGETGVVNSGTAVGGQNVSLAKDASVTFVYQLRPTQPGTFQNAVQITASQQSDPDSQPNSGTGDGQDDAAQVDVRTVLNSSALYPSPNPNQSPLLPVASNQPTPDPAKADLSLAMHVSSRTPAVGEPVTFTVSVRNAGGLAANTVVVRDTLRGLNLLSSPTNVSVVSTGNGYVVVEGTVSSVAVGSSVQLVFTAAATTSGYLANRAQIWSSSTPDADSTPGTTGAPGEDDAAWVDLRIR